MHHKRECRRRAALSLGFTAFFLVLVLATPPSGAVEPLTLRGEAVSGGLIEGLTEPGAEVTFEEQPVQVSPAGQFLIGFSRDVSPEASLVVRFANGDTVSRTIAVRQRPYETQHIGGLPQRMVTPPPEVQQRILRENRLIAEVRARNTAETWWQSGWIWPTRGRVTGVYGSGRILNGKPRQPHYGIDIAAPEGTPVRASADGTVVLAHVDMYYTGGTVILDHGHGLSSAYLHLAALRIEEGQFVRKGTVIGTVGSTGRSTGAHLDWRVNLFDIRIDPALLVPPMRASPPLPKPDSTG